MIKIVKAKIRRIGDSIGLFLPKRQLDEAGIDIGDKIEIAILPHKKDFSGFGLAKNFEPFVRNKE